jgi:hypothetical protein
MLCDGGQVYDLVEYLNLSIHPTLIRLFLTDVQVKYESFQTFHSFAVSCFG